MSPLIRDERHCLFLDVDGTLVDIAARPEEVVVPEPLVGALDRIARSLSGAVALISGRTIADLDTLFSPSRFSAGGVHGAEIRFDPAGPITIEPGDLLPMDLIDDIRKSAAGFPGTIVENKRFSMAVHYRLTPQAGPFLEAELGAIVAGAHDPQLRILPGHMVFEIKRATFDKGLAIERFMARAPFAGRTPVFLGDDITDKPGFLAVLERGGQAYSVGQTLPGTTGSFPDPASVRSWLAGLAAAETSHA